MVDASGSSISIPKLPISAVAPTLQDASHIADAIVLTTDSKGSDFLNSYQHTKGKSRMEAAIKSDKGDVRGLDNLFSLGAFLNL